MTLLEQSSTQTTSFRDPAGFFWTQDKQAFRWVSPNYQKDVLEFLSHSSTQEWMKEKRLVQTKLLSSEAQKAALKVFSNITSGIVLEHSKVRFPSYPYEWSPEMLFNAAQLTLDLASKALEFGYSLKDATPYNVLFEGPHPCFIDFLSFEKRNPLDGTWKAYGQFVRTFLLPLLAQKKLGIPLKETFLGSRDGIHTSDLYKKLGLFERLQPSIFGLITLPEWLSKIYKSSSSPSYQSKLFSDPQQASFVLKSLFKHLQKSLNRLKPPTHSSAWSGYGDCTHCTPEYQQIKENWIRDFMQEHPVTSVFDIGCNTGHYSRLFASYNASLISVDLDTAVIDSLSKQNRENNLDILSLVIDLAWPSPALGWDNLETKSFLDRAKGYFDGVLMYAIIHHLLISAQIPLPHIVRLISQLTQKWLIIEYVAPQDPMFQALTRGRMDLYKDFNVEFFEKHFSESFEIVRKKEIVSQPRVLYWMRKR